MAGGCYRGDPDAMSMERLSFGREPAAYA